MITITATEFKTNFGKYLTLVNTEEITITKNNKKIAKISKPEKTPLDEIHEILAGVDFSNYQDLTKEDIRKMRMKDRYGIDL